MERVYILASSTEAVLKELDEPVELRYYFSHSDPYVPAPVRAFASRIEDLLVEYQVVAPSRIVLEKYDPQPDSEAVEAAKRDGIEPIVTEKADNYYLGLCVAVGKETVAIPQFSLKRERALEYEITRAIQRVRRARKPIVGIMSSLPVWGGTNQLAAGTNKVVAPWVFLSELNRDYEVRPIEMDTPGIEDAVETLLLIHPVALSEQAEYALDRFVLRGGRLMAFLDPIAWSEQRPSDEPGKSSPKSALDRFLKAWGITFDASKVVADARYSTTVRRKNRELAELPWLLSVDAQGVNTNDLITVSVDKLLVPTAGAFAGEPASGLRRSVLIQSTPRVALVEKIAAALDSPQPSKMSLETAASRPIAIGLTGRFRTVFANGANASKQTAEENTVLLFADADLLADLFTVQSQSLFGQAIVQPINDNLVLLRDAVEMLASRLENAPVRRRRGAPAKLRTVPGAFQANKPRSAEEQAELAASVKRLVSLPIEQGIKQLQNASQAEQDKIVESLKQELDAVNERLNGMQDGKTAAQKKILTPEQQHVVSEFTKLQSAHKKKLANLRRRLQAQIETLENLKGITNTPARQMAP